MTLVDDLRWHNEKATKALASYKNYDTINETIRLNGDGCIKMEFMKEMTDFMLISIEQRGWTINDCILYLNEASHTEWSSSPLSTAMSTIRCNVAWELYLDIRFDKE
jgi:hypothetical protein